MVLRKLDEACVWLHNSNLPPEGRDALFDRILLRKVSLGTRFLHERHIERDGRRCCSY